MEHRIKQDTQLPVLPAFLFLGVAFAIPFWFFATEEPEPEEVEVVEEVLPEPRHIAKFGYNERPDGTDWYSKAKHYWQNYTLSGIAVKKGSELIEQEGHRIGTDQMRESLDELQETVGSRR